MSSSELMKRPECMRSPPSTHLDTESAHVRIFNVRSFSSVVKPLSPTSTTVSFKSSRGGTRILAPTSTTIVPKDQQTVLLQQRKQQLTSKNVEQKDHNSDNMQVLLTTELNRVHTEYKSIKLYQNPVALSLQRVASALKDKELAFRQKQQQTIIGSIDSSAATFSATSSAPSATASSWSSSLSSTSNKSPHQAPYQQRRASSHTVHDNLLNKKEARRYSLSQFFLDKSPPPTLISKFFGMSSASANQPYHSPPQIASDRLEAKELTAPSIGIVAIDES